MKDQGQDEYLRPEDLRHPLLEKLSDLAAEYAQMRFLIVFPQAEGWGHVRPGTDSVVPEFCRYIHSSKEGARHCKMCHILMSVAACSRGISEETCHTGAKVLVSPIGQDDRNPMAVLSTCVYANSGDPVDMEALKAQAAKLGLDSDKLKAAYDKLPRLQPERVQLAQAIMTAVGEAVREIRRGAKLSDELSALRGSQGREPDIRSMVEEELKAAVLVIPRSGKPLKAKKGRKQVPAAIAVVCNLVDRKPNMPYTVSEIAAAARITPNHFSSLFHHHKRKSFSEYLADRRITLAKELLRDLTLNVAEVAAASGYDDPGYFARVFKKRTGRTPRAWRSTLSLAQR